MNAVTLINVLGTVAVTMGAYSILLTALELWIAVVSPEKSDLLRGRRALKGE